MPRSKKTAPKRQRQSDDVVHMEPPSDHPLFQYFSRLDDLNNYIFNFSERIVISPRLNKVDYELDSHRLASIWNLDRINTNDACLFDGNKTPESWGPHVKRQAFDLFNIQRIPKKKIMCTIFNKEMRMLHYLINYILMPRSTGHSHVTIDDLVTMWAMINDIKIYWPYFIAHNMLKFTKSDHSKGLGYAYLWTRIFEYLGIDVSGESGRGISQNNIIDERTIHHMGRGMEEGEEQQPPPPPQEQAPQEQAGPSEQPSMRDLMQVLLRIEQNQANMDTHLTRVDQRLSRVEQHLEIDEDEDQD
ncbi:hypothetical protein PIB30_094732 [Stylosanthes scabra]|uniref:Uncharacterized protein n=1 Tax=Stylosanthes scabra TaxID=79078 RepID=A0ABU6YUT3_9FABA|nr:hypothetical protein [Stylosanthes scabra]